MFDHPQTLQEAEDRCPQQGVFRNGLLAKSEEDEEDDRVEGCVVERKYQRGMRERRDVFFGKLGDETKVMVDFGEAGVVFDGKNDEGDGNTDHIVDNQNGDIGDSERDEAEISTDTETRAGRSEDRAEL